MNDVAASVRYVHVPFPNDANAVRSNVARALYRLRRWEAAVPVGRVHAAPDDCFAHGEFTPEMKKGAQGPFDVVPRHKLAQSLHVLYIKHVR